MNAEHVAPVAPSGSRKRKYPSRKCSVVNCLHTDLTGHMHTFPVLKDDGSNWESWIKWIELCGNESLYRFSPQELNKRYFICGNHFDDEQYVIPTKRQRLRRNAEPTLHGGNAVPEDLMLSYKNRYFPQQTASSVENSHKVALDFIADSSVAVIEERPISTDTCCDVSCVESDKNDACLVTRNEPAKSHDQCDVPREDIVISVQVTTLPDSAGESSIAENEGQQLSTDSCCVVSAAEFIENRDGFVSSNETDALSFTVGQNCDVSEEVVVESVEASTSSVAAKPIKRRCCVNGCSNNNNSHTMFSFPRVVKTGGSSHVDKEALSRCMQWIKFTGNYKVTSKNLTLLSKHFYICDVHFESNNYYTVSGRKQLKKGVVPTLLSPKPLSDATVQSCVESSGIVLAVENVVHHETESDVVMRRLASDKYGDLRSVRTRNLAKQFEDKLKSFKFEQCEVCKEKFLYYPGMKRAHRSKSCCKKFSSINNMDPGDVPSCLKDLTYIEECLIARVHPVLSVYKLKGLQYGYRGNVINFWQDVKEFARELPHRIEDLTSVVTVKFENNRNEAWEFRVRANKIKEALLWLKANNPYYHDVEISTENLESLPADGNVFDRMMSFSLAEDGGENSDSSDDKEEDEGEVCNSDSEEGLDCEKVTRSGVPTQGFNSQNDQINSVLNWPHMSSDPVSESTPGFIVCAFPSLFPRGNCDLRDQRQQEVKMHEYFKHFLCYGDDRFSNHKSFRFFAFNMWMRHTALSSGNLFVSKDELSKMNVEQLKEHIQLNPTSMKKLMFMGSNIRGSKAYWKSRCGELRDMVEQLGLPTIFLTMSAADLYWPDLFRLLTGESDISKISMKKRRRLLQDNPLVVDMFFQFRLQCFIETVLEPKFGVIDYWFRIEYQHRGSPHVHGLFWLKDAPDLKNYVNSSEEEKLKICNYFHGLVSAVNPKLDCDMPTVHPCEVMFQDVDDVETDLAQILKKVQTHSCSKEYCKRYDKKSKQTICRFHFPKLLRDSAELKVNTESSELEFFPEQNDVFLNKFNPFIISTWRANIDIAPVLSKRAVIEYLTKYVSKSEVPSSTLKEICANVCGSLNGNDRAKRAIQKILIKNCVERDISSQEVCHILMGAKLFSAGGRNFVVVYTNATNWMPVTENVADNAISLSSGKSFMQKYSQRPDTLNNVSMWDVAKNFNVRNFSKSKIANIVRVFPRLVLGSDEAKNEEFYRQKVLLHVPWREEKELKKEDDTWKDVYVHHNLENLLSTGIDINVTTSREQNTEEDLDVMHQNERDEDWMIVSRMCSRGSAQTVELGRREVDLCHDWHTNSEKYKTFGDYHHLMNFVENEKKKDNDPVNVEDLPNVEFSIEQKAVKQLMEDQINSLHSGVHDVPKRVLVQGKAGTGKSLLIKYLVDRLMKEFGPSSFLLLGPTGVSAINIGGATIHSELSIPAKKQKFQELRGEAARKFCDKIEKIKFIIIDEYSMIGCSMLGMIDKRLREGTGINEPFGNINIYFFGDYKQLPPVKDVALSGGECKSDLANHGKNCFSSIEKFFVLQRVFRQNDGQFLDILNRLSTGDVTASDYEALKTRFIHNVNFDTKKKFENAIRLFSTKEAVDSYNTCKLHKLQDENGNFLPIARIPAQHHGVGASQGSVDEAGGLSSVFYAGVGTRVMLKTNLWVKKGLVNGAMGTVIDLLYEDGCQSPENAPTIIMVKFDNYKGPGIGADNLVPLTAVSRSWTRHQSGSQCTRKQFPLVVCYACSIHKSQGLTLDQAVIDIGSREFAMGLSYVGLSRVKSFDGLLLQPFPFQRLEAIKLKRDLILRRNFERQFFL